MYFNSVLRLDSAITVLVRCRWSIQLLQRVVRGARNEDFDPRLGRCREDDDIVQTASRGGGDDHTNHRI